jgi:hypothetical protein
LLFLDSIDLACETHTVGVSCPASWYRGSSRGDTTYCESAVLLGIGSGGEGRRLLFCMLIRHNEGIYCECTTCEVCYLYTPLLTCIIAARYSLEFHAYKPYVGGGTCRIVSGHGGVESCFESLGYSKRHCATCSVGSERLKHFRSPRFSNIGVRHHSNRLVRIE